MTVNFWGVRGSVPTPVTPAQIKAKISSVVQRITPEDVASEESREKFLANLPQWIYGTVGGNTPCVELTGENGTKIILDAGSGLRNLGKFGRPPANRHYNIMFSHFHWDHIQGLPFFDYAYSKNFSFDFFSPFNNMQKYLSNQMCAPYFPVKFDSLSSNMKFHTIPTNIDFTVGGIKVRAKKMHHPGSSYSYSFTEGEKKFVYATDVELSPEDFEMSAENIAFFDNVDTIVIDCQYTAEDAIAKEHWGHSSFASAIDFAVHWKIKNLYLFHIDPTYDDKKMDSILKSARWYANYITQNKVNVYLSVEGQTVKI